MAGFGVDHRDDLFEGHTLGDSHAAFPVVFDVWSETTLVQVRRGRGIGADGPETLQD